jgi:hypothetical protein
LSVTPNTTSRDQAPGAATGQTSSAKGPQARPGTQKKTPPLGEHVAGRPSDVCGASFFFDVEPIASWWVVVEECGFDRKGRVQCDRPFNESRL